MTIFLSFLLIIFSTCIISLIEVHWVPLKKKSLCFRKPHASRQPCETGFQPCRMWGSKWTPGRFWAPCSKTPACRWLVERLVENRTNPGGTRGNPWLVEAFGNGCGGWCWIGLHVSTWKNVLSMIFHMIWKWIQFILHIWTSQSSIIVWNIHQLFVHYWWHGKRGYPDFQAATLPENRPSQKETSIPTIHCQVRTVSFREGILL